MDFQRNRLNRRVIHDLKTRSTIGLVFYLVIAFVIFFADGYYHRHPGFSGFFLAAVVAVCAIRAVHVMLMPRLETLWERGSNIFFITTVIMTALIWGIGFATIMVQDGEHQTQLIMAICSTGLCAGGVVAFIPERMLSLVFNALMLIPCAAGMWIFDANRPLALLVATFCLYMVLVALRGSKEYWDALENEFLLGQRTRDLEEISRVDVLTGLFNRRHFDEVLEYQWRLSLREQNPLTILICDIDFFKKINDTHGHLAGDAFLRSTATLLESVFKRETDIVARFGGEEFIVFLGNTDTEPARIMAETFRKAMESFVLPYRNVTLKATISIGISTCVPNQSTNSNQLINEADQALYRAKREGRNRTCVFTGNRSA